MTMLLALAACPSSQTGPADTDQPSEPVSPTADTANTTDTTPTAATGDTALPPAEVLQAACETTDNPLRFSCTATLDRSAEVTVTVTADKLPEHSYTDAAALEHEWTVWGLVPSSEYTWTIGSFTGTLSTGALPSDLADATIEVTGAPPAIDAVLRPVDCGLTEYFVMIDGQGRIVWYQPDDVFYRNNMNGYEWSQASRSVMSVGQDRFVEQHVSGAQLLSLERGVDFDGTLHHDATRWGEYRYLLFERPVGSVNVDGIHVFDGTTLVDTFYLEDHFTPGTGGGDWGHGNGLNATEDGDLILSLLTFDAVLQIDGDPASPTFLEIDWHGAGSADEGLPGASVFPAAGKGNTFNAQHNISRVGDDLWVFDNTGDGRRSRAIRQHLDLAKGTLTTTGEWWFDERCRNQGGALPLPGGGTLATCANRGQVWSFDEGGTRPRWTLDASCGGETGFLNITRAIPVWIE
ncbi:MAG: hypothetical protein KTR31_26785 [Myxococcales bacterium]|nr:hypothetical protein [Myxococcales bacterium]